MRIAVTVTAAVLAGSVLTPAGAIAAVRFDPVTNTGVVDRGDVQKAFGWDDATLRANAAAVRFTAHEMREAVYSVLCDRRPPAEVRTDPGSGSTSLDIVVTKDAGTGVITGFRLTGAVAGASSMGLRPQAGHPCPAGDGQLIRRVTHVSTTVTRALSAEYGDEQRFLLKSAPVSTTAQNLA